MDDDGVIETKKDKKDKKRKKWFFYKNKLNLNFYFVIHFII